MKPIFTGLCVSFLLSANAQTPLIAHKSHSGMASTFVIDPSGNFGIPPPRLVQVIRLNDTTSIKVYDDRHGGSFSYDTVYNHPYYSNYLLNVDSMNRNTYFKVDYINFKHSPDTLKQKLPAHNPAGISDGKIPANLEIQQPIPENNPPKKKKKSYLLFLFGITGGGLLLFRALNRLFTPQTTV